MWERLTQGAVAGLFIVLVTIVVFTVGGFVGICVIHAGVAQSTSTGFVPPSATSPAPTADPTLKAVQALGAKIDNKVGRIEGRLNSLDERVKKLEWSEEGIPPVVPDKQPCGDGWSEETIPPVRP